MSEISTAPPDQRIEDTGLAWDMAYAEKPYRELGAHARELGLGETALDMAQHADEASNEIYKAASNETHTANEEAALAAGEPIPTSERHAGEEIDKETEVVVFTDSRGIERRPHPLVPEIIASTDIQEIVSEHFATVDRVVAEVEAELPKIKEADFSDVFDVLSDDLLREIVETAQQHFDTVYAIRPVTRYRTVTERKFFRKIEWEEAYREETVVAVGGGIVDPSDERQVDRFRNETHYYKNRAIEPERREQEKELMQKRILDLLTGTKEGPEDHARGGVGRLSLLAKRVFEAGMKEEDIPSLSYEDITELVPEMESYFSSTREIQEAQTNFAKSKALKELGESLAPISPIAVPGVAKLYYSEALLTKMAELEYRISTDRYAVFGKQLEQQREEYIETRIGREQQAMLKFFDGALPADLVLIHATPFGERIIKDGMLRAPGGMQKGQYSFNTLRSHIKGIGNNGSRAIHWASAEHTNRYTPDETREETIERMSKRIESVNGSGFVKHELGKGGLASIHLAGRLGDIIQVAPYGGYREVSSGSHTGKFAKTHIAGMRRGVVKLTEKGWQQAQERLDLRAEIKDIAFVAAPETSTSSEELYGYGIPLDQLTIGVPSRDPETVHTLLRELGWSENDIATRTYVFRDNKPESEVQDRAYATPKYPRSVVMPLSRSI